MMPELEIEPPRCCNTRAVKTIHYHGQRDDDDQPDTIERQEAGVYRQPRNCTEWCE